MSLHKVFPRLFSPPVMKEREKPEFYVDLHHICIPEWVCDGWPLLLSQEEHERINREKPWLLTRASPEALPGLALTKQFGPLDKNGKRVHKFNGHSALGEDRIPTLALEYIFRSSAPEVKTVTIPEFSSLDPYWTHDIRVCAENDEPVLAFTSDELEPPPGMVLSFSKIHGSDAKSFEEIPKKLFEHINSRLDQIEKYLDNREKHKGDPSYKDPFPVQGPRAPYVPSGCKIDHGIGCTIVEFGENCEAWNGRQELDLFGEDGLRARSEIASSDVWKQSHLAKIVPVTNPGLKQNLADVSALVVGATGMPLTVDKRDGNYCLVGTFNGTEVKIQFAPGNAKKSPSDHDAWDRIVINPGNEVADELAKSIIEHYEMAIEAPFQADQQTAKVIDRQS